MEKQSVLYLIFVIIFSVFCSSSCNNYGNSAGNMNVTFVKDIDNKRIEVLIDGRHFTSYIWPDNMCKPVLYPLFSSSGAEITRGFPVNPKVGEQIDHAHQTGIWFTYGNVNGCDFWGNGSHGLGTKNENGGIIQHRKIEKLSEGKGEGILITTESWLNCNGEELLKGKTEYHFIANESVRIIDWVTTLSAGEKEVLMPDTKEGMFGIRVGRQLELPSKGEQTVLGADGQPLKIDANSDLSVSGNYLNSEGVTGTSVWGKRARWIHLFGNIGDEKISIVVCDHPKNPCYPTYWHARSYGLLAANPLGWKDFTSGKEELNFKIQARESVVFRYRIIIRPDKYFNVEDINDFAEKFALRY